MSWDYDSLWQKAKLYVQRAMDEDRDGPLFPFWSTLALELLARATLAKIHPALLADPQHKQGESVLYACGIGDAKEARSIEAATLFKRCRIVVPNFTDEDRDTCLELLRRRNEELHTGTPVFEDLPTRLWLSDYYRICALLLSFQGHTLADLFGADEATAAEEMIQTAKRDTIDKVRRLIGEAKGRFQRLEQDEQTRQREIAIQMNLLSGIPLSKHVICPACGADARINGKQVSASEPKLQDDMIMREIVILPTTFKCYSCDLMLEGYSQLDAAGLGGQFTKTEMHDPLKYYNEDEDPADYWDDLYGNE